MDKGKKKFIESNEFSCYFIGISNIHYKCCESKNSYHIRKIFMFFKIYINIYLKNLNVNSKIMKILYSICRDVYGTCINIVNDTFFKKYI